MKKLSLIIIALLVVLVCCKKTPQVNIQYVDVEREVLTIGTTTANIQCDYEYIATLKSAKLYYGRTEDNMNYVTMRVVQSVLYAEIDGLSSNTTYRYYYEFENGFNSMQSEVKTFVTESIPVSLPTVITADVSEITANSAVCGGEVTNDGGCSITARGVCWSTLANPTISDSFTADGTGIGSFVSDLTDLSSNTTYHVRAYATNELGTAYGLDKEFNTLMQVPTGAINGMFTVNDGQLQGGLTRKVYFSQGNLQYKASTNTWRFAEHQLDFIGEENTNISSSYDGWIDLFGWGTSGWNNGNVYYHPYDNELLTEWYAYDHGYGYGPTDGTCYLYGLYGEYANADWGVYNPISNGGNMPNQWRNLGEGEWWCLLIGRSTQSGIRYAKAVINGVNGLVLLPDNWDASVYALNYPNQSEVPYSINEISIDNWGIMESNGVVFLPAAGYRGGTDVYYAGDYGRYWEDNYNHSTTYLTSSANSMSFNDYQCLDWGLHERYLGFSVRLVQDANQ